MYFIIRAYIIHTAFFSALKVYSPVNILMSQKELTMYEFYCVHNSNFIFVHTSDVSNFIRADS